jgi:hypothetical protein
MYASTTKFKIFIINLDLYLKKLIKSLHNIFIKDLIEQQAIGFGY